MKITPFFIVIFSLSTLTACRSAPPDKVEQINHLQVPLILPGEKPPAVQTSHIASLYQENKQQIDSLQQPQITVSSGRLSKRYFKRQSSPARLRLPHETGAVRYGEPAIPEG
jgi:hypothetical protein